MEDRRGEAGGSKQPPCGRRASQSAAGNTRPGNLYNGVLKPTIGYGIKGAIWYQGESNAGRAYQYRDLFPAHDPELARRVGPGRFPLLLGAAGRLLAEKPEPGDSAWAELREAQTMTHGQAAQHRRGGDHRHRRRRRHPPAEQAGCGQAAGPLGAGPRLRQELVVCQSPTYKSMEKQGNKIVAEASTTRTAAADRSTSRRARALRSPARTRKLVWAKAKIVGPTRSRSGASRSQSRSPCATPGPTTRSATCTTGWACR